MHISPESNDVLIAGILSTILILLQITFGFLMKRKKEAFLKYHQVLGVLIFLVVLANIFLSPVISIIALIVLLAVLSQIIIGFLVIKNKKLVKYHKPLGILIIILAIANLVLALI